MNRMVSHCPVCAGNLHTTELTCVECSTTIGGSFEAPPFSRLGSEHAEFLELFLRSRGNLSSAAEALEISFPTASRRLDSVLMALGYMDAQTNGKNAIIPREANMQLEKERERVLELLDRGEITAEEATRRLKEI